MKRLITMLGAAAVAVGAMLPTSAAAEAAALSATVSGDAIAVSAAAGVLDDTSALYLVWDAEDRGTSLADWPEANRIAYSGSPAVSSAAATYVFSEAGVPAGSYVRVLATSDVRLIGGYAALAKGQYVNTGVKDTAACGFEIRYRPTGGSGNYSSLMGGVHDQFTVGQAYDNTDRYYVRYGAGTEVGNPAYALPDTTAPHTVRIGDAKLSLDGQQLTTKPDATTALGSMSGTIGRKNVDVLLGVAWHRTTAGEVNGSYCQAEWYYATLLDGAGKPLANLVPALRGDTASPEAVFYDTVSGTCIANAGTGTLAYSGATTNTVALAAAATEPLYNGRVATWTGGGDASDATDPLNWSVTDMGVPVAGAVPANGTKIADCTLAADADWSALAATGTWMQPVDYADFKKGVYVDTEFCPDSNTRVVMDVTIRNINGDNPYPFRLFAVYTNGWNNGAFCLGNDNKGLFSAFGNSGGTDNDTNTWIPVGRHTVDYDKGVVKVDGATKKTRTGTFALDRPLYLFLTNDKGVASDTNTGPFRFHSCQIYDNGTLVRDYVPVVVGGAVKVYDRKNGELVEFGKKAGTETVTPGAASGGRLGGDVVGIDGTIDLAGHKLTVGDLSGTGTITDSVGGGELHVAVGAGFGVENTAIALAGSLKLVKEGAGLLVAAKGGQTYAGGTLVKGGTARSGVGDRPWGAAKSLVTVADGGCFDWAGVVSETSTAYSFDIAGTGPDGNGALRNSVASDGWNLTCIADLTLSDDALVACYGFFGFAYNGDNSTWHLLTLNGHTLNVKMASDGSYFGVVFAMRRVKAVDAGTIAFVEADGRGCYPSFFGGSSDLSSATLDLGEGYRINMDSANVALTVGTFIDRRRSGSSLDFSDGKRGNAVTVLDCFRPMTANLVRTVALGDATHLSPVLDLSALDAPFVLPSDNYSMSSASGATVLLRLGERKVTSGTPVVTWSGAKPAWVDALRFARGDTARGYGISVRDDGIYVFTGLTITVR